ncbi:hypothetical protein PBRA_005539 [Plasmodiophora brassicae]|nr:hypothetical protein PBRA_005539 [Plasmodiophora brassicae]
MAAFSTVRRAGRCFRLSYWHVGDVDRDRMDWAFRLTRANMKDQYDKCGGEWKWNDYRKRLEMEESPARYVFVRLAGDADREDRDVGFAHLRFENEDGAAQVYVYEVQVDREFQGIGLGKLLMQVVELSGCLFGLDKVVLTVFDTNEKALGLYRRLKYIKDASDPSLCNMVCERGYQILCKLLPKTG